MGYLYDIAQRHLDAYGVRASALARRMGTVPQTLDSWKNRGLKELPEQWLLEALARETRTPYGDVLTAVLRDIGYLSKGSDGDGDAAATNRAEVSPAAGKVVIPKTPQRRGASQKRPREPRQ